MGTVIVGVAGLLIGAAIGWAVAAYRAKGAWTAHHDSGPGPLAGFASSSSAAPLVRVPAGQGPPAEEIERMRKIAPSLARVDSAPLERVVACGQIAAVGELAVELVAIELRGPGGQLLLRWRRLDIDPMRPPKLDVDRHGRPKFAHFGQPVVALADDVRTTYEAAPAGGSWSLASGEAHVRFVPAVPPEARRLSVTVERFGGGRWRPPRAPEELVFEGPWRFEVPLVRPPTE
jgi:hypothetical protein